MLLLASLESDEQPEKGLVGVPYHYTEWEPSLKHPTNDTMFEYELQGSSRDAVGMVSFVRLRTSADSSSQ
jgi:hypothetical protein